MTTFKLPDLGEGLADAKIREWYVKVGDMIKLEQPLVSVETAKALVDIPAPYTGTVSEIFGDVGAVIETGHPLVRISRENEQDAEPDNAESGTVVGNIVQSNAPLSETHSMVNTTSIHITPTARLLAKQLGVNQAELAELAKLNTMITPEMVKHAAARSLSKQTQLSSATATSESTPGQTSVLSTTPGPVPATIQTPVELSGKQQTLSGMRRAMFTRMQQTQQHVVATSVHDEADIFHWYGQADITTRLIRAIVAACQAEPILNASLDDSNCSYELHNDINLGLAIDTPSGLYVPVLKNVGNLDDQQLRVAIEQFKQQAQQNRIYQHDLQGATITLSNFGIFSGRYANAIILPPQVAIIATGKLYHGVVAMDGAITIHPLLPLSLTFDHRLITGGEATRFLQTLITTLIKKI